MLMSRTVSETCYDLGQAFLNTDMPQAAMQRLSRKESINGEMRLVTIPVRQWLPPALNWEPIGSWNKEDRDRHLRDVGGTFQCIKTI